MASLLHTSSSPAESPPQPLDSPRSDMKEVDITELSQKLEILAVAKESISVELGDINIT
jgi:hypothetical protein